MRLCVALTVDVAVFTRVIDPVKLLVLVLLRDSVCAQVGEPLDDMTVLNEIDELRDAVRLWVEEGLLFVSVSVFSAVGVGSCRGVALVDADATVFVFLTVEVAVCDGV